MKKNLLGCNIGYKIGVVVVLICSTLLYLGLFSGKLIPSIDMYSKLYEVDVEDEEILKSIDTEIEYEEITDNGVVKYSVIQKGNVRYTRVTEDNKEYRIYQIEDKVVGYEAKTKKVVDIEENEEYTSVLEDTDYVFDFCNELTFNEYVRAFRNRERTRVEINRYQVDIAQDKLYKGSERVEFITDIFGRIKSGIYYKEPIGKWNELLIGAGVKDIKIPKDVLRYFEGVMLQN